MVYHTVEIKSGVKISAFEGTNRHGHDCTFLPELVPIRVSSAQLGNIGNFWFITKSRFYTNFPQKEVDFFLAFFQFLCRKGREN